MLVDLLLVLGKKGAIGILGDLCSQLGMTELDDTCNQVAQVLEEFVVVGSNEAVPLKLGVASLWSV